MDLKDLLNKAGGEGSKGGTVIGHTASGKPIYRSGNHTGHKEFKPEDHAHASALHNDIYDKAQEKLNSKRDGDPTFKPDQKVYDFLQHHHTQMKIHNEQANKNRDGDAKEKEDKIKHDIGSNPEKMDKKTIGEYINNLARKGKTKEAKSLYNKLKPMFEEKKKKEVKKSLIELLEKGRALPVGTQRTWGGRDYVKHSDGWVATTGPHKGKLHEGKSLTPKQDHPNAKSHAEAADTKPNRLDNTDGKTITFMGPGGKEYTGKVQGEVKDGKVIIDFPDAGLRNIEVSSMKDIGIHREEKEVKPKKSEKKDKKLSWPPQGFKKPEKKGNKTQSSTWYVTGSEGGDGRPSTKGEESEFAYKSPSNSTCNLVGNVAFGKASRHAQRTLNENLAATEVLLSDMGIRLKSPIDFMCQDMEDSSRGVMAQFISKRQHNHRINLVKNVRTVNKSMLHEIGHAIDYSMEKKGIYGSYFRGSPKEFKEELTELTTILRKSSFYEATGAKDAITSDKDGIELGEERRYAEYLKDPSEVFARAFEVYSYSHAKKMVADGRMPEEYTDNFMPDFLRAGYSRTRKVDQKRQDKTIEDVTRVMDKIFSNRAIQKALQEVDLLESLRKNTVNLDDQGSAIETGDYGNDLYHGADNPLIDKVKDALEDHVYGADPVEITINDTHTLVAVKTDEGVYSGHVKRIKDGQEENILKIEKQTLPTIVQMLKIKEIIEPKTEPKEEVKEGLPDDNDYKMKIIDLLSKLI